MSTSTATENAALVRGAYEAFERGDMATVTAAMAPDIRWHTNGRSAVAGTFHGIDDVMASLGRLAAESGGTFAAEVHDVLASDDHVVVLGRVSADRNGRHLEDNYCHVFHVSGGLMTEVWVVNQDPYAQDEFWS